MSGMAEVLAAHQRWTDTKNLGYYRTEYTCQCGGTFWAGEHPEDPTYDAAYAAHQAEALSAAGFGSVVEAKAGARNLKMVRGELKSFGKNLDSWESQGHSTVTIRHMRQLLVRLAAAVLGEG